MTINLKTIQALVLGVFLLISCNLLAEPVPTDPAIVSSPTNLPISTSTFSPGLSATASPSITPEQVPSIFPTEVTLVQEGPIPEELPVDYPLSIEYLRQREYPGSSISIEQELEPGSNYRRFYTSYKSEGLKIYALMTIPDDETPENGWPVIIFNHGYIPPDVYRTTERYEDYIDELARSGYIVFRSDYRGHDRSEGEARGAYGYPDYTIDVLNALKSLENFSEADPNRIGMWGHSMGGYITLRCMVISRDIKVGVIWAGVVASYPDLVYNWPGQTSETPEKANIWRTSLEAIYGPPSLNPVFWDAISANSYLTELSGPIQLHHGTADVEVPAEFSTKLSERLIDIPIPAELYLYENDNHNLSNSFNLAMKRTIQYFDTYLK